MAVLALAANPDGADHRRKRSAISLDLRHPGAPVEAARREKLPNLGLIIDDSDSRKEKARLEKLDQDEKAAEKRLATERATNDAAAKADWEKKQADNKAAAAEAEAKRKARLADCAARGIPAKSCVSGSVQ